MLASGSVDLVQQDPRRVSSRQRILAAQLGLLYGNANLGVVVTLLAATVLAALQWKLIAQTTIIAWWIFMVLVSLLRYAFARRYRLAERQTAHQQLWRISFAVGAGLAGAGWGAAGVLLYPPTHLINQVFLVFVLGGMMLGACSLLAPRPEAFFSFLIPTGLAPAIRLALQGDEAHLAMALLAGVFTLATLVTTRRMFRMVDTSLRLQIENQTLVEDLQTANQETAGLNQALELRVQERTATLQQLTEQLRAEIAQREHTEEELLRARKLESIGVLAGGIAHDFNNFLTVVQGNIEVARTHLDAAQGAQPFLDQAASACQRAKFLSSQLLTFAKGGAPVRRIVSLAQLLTDAVHLARTGAAVSIDVHIQEDLWSAEVDPGQIGQVLHNILINAREAMPDGGRIEVCAENILDATDILVRISIRDHGSGIPADTLRKIFDPYFTTKPGGSGLGLATAYAIVVKHGGRITAESTPGVGTLFAIYLPASLEAPQPVAPAIAPLQTGCERLLVMDDDEALQILFKAVLTKLGYEVEMVRDGAEALSLYESARKAGKRFDAVLLDLTVTGGMGGEEAAARLRASDPSAKLIVSSGYSEAPVMSHFADYGFDAVILKPWTVREMSEVLRRVLTSDAGQPPDA